MHLNGGAYEGTFPNQLEKQTRTKKMKNRHIIAQIIRGVDIESKNGHDFIELRKCNSISGPK
jgi:hypothetical protein